MTRCYLNDVVLTRKLLSAKENTKANFLMPTDCKLQRTACFQRCSQYERSKQYHAVTYSKNSGKKKVRMFFNMEDQQCFISIPFHMDMCENFKQNKRKYWCNSYREEPTLLENHQAPKPSEKGDVHQGSTAMYLKMYSDSIIVVLCSCIQKEKISCTSRNSFVAAGNYHGGSFLRNKQPQTHIGKPISIQLAEHEHRNLELNTPKGK